MFQSHWKVLHSNFSWPQIFYLVNKYILPFPKGKNPSRKTRNGEWNFVFRKYLIIYKGNTSHAPGKGTLFWPVVKNLLAHISSSYFPLALFIPSYLRKLIMHLKWFWVKWVGSMAQWCIFWEELKTNFEEVIFNLLFWVPPPGPAQMWYQKKAVFLFPISVFHQNSFHLHLCNSSSILIYRALLLCPQSIKYTVPIPGQHKGERWHSHCGICYWYQVGFVR